MIHIFHEFIDPAPYLKTEFEFRELPEESVWHNRLSELDTDIGLPLLKNIHGLINSTVEDPVWADSFSYSLWRVGDSQSPHADAEKNDGTPNEFPWRTHGCVLYLNNDFGGGEIYFPQHDIELKPEPGTLVWFPATAEYLHGVREVTSGLRLTISSFWAKEPPYKHYLYDND
jgi:hypothetical protein